MVHLLTVVLMYFAMINNFTLTGLKHRIFKKGFINLVCNLKVSHCLVNIFFLTVNVPLHAVAR